MIQTRLPSVMGEGEAEFCFRKSLLPESICCCHRIDPSFRSIAIRNILSCAAFPGFVLRNRGDPSSAEVTKILSCQIAGVAALQLGIFVRQWMFCESDQTTGRFRAF